MSLHKHDKNREKSDIFCCFGVICNGSTCKSDRFTVFSAGKNMHLLIAVKTKNNSQKVLSHNCQTLTDIQYITLDFEKHSI